MGIRKYAIAFLSAVMFFLIQPVSAAFTQQNQVSALTISNYAESGIEIPSDIYFLIQVKVGGVLLPEGTLYAVGNEIRTVEAPGRILLRVNETAVIDSVIIHGVDFRVTELSAALDGYQPRYICETGKDGASRCTSDGVSGVTLGGGDVHITIVNSMNPIT